MTPFGRRSAGGVHTVQVVAPASCGPGKRRRLHSATAPIRWRRPTAIRLGDRLPTALSPLWRFYHRVAHDAASPECSMMYASGGRQPPLIVMAMAPRCFAAKIASGTRCSCRDHSDDFAAPTPRSWGHPPPPRPDHHPLGDDALRHRQRLVRVGRRVLGTPSQLRSGSTGDRPAVDSTSVTW